MWSLLSLSVAASLQLDCRSMAVDAASGAIAAVVRPPPMPPAKDDGKGSPAPAAAAAAAAATAAAAASGDVLMVFEAPLLRPTAAWVLGSAAALGPALLCIPRGSPLCPGGGVLLVSADYELTVAPTGDASSEARGLFRV